MLTKNSMRHAHDRHKYLNEANFLGVAAEALSAAHQTVLSDQPMGVPTDTAVKKNEKLNSMFWERTE